MLSDIFRVTLVQSRTTDARGAKLMFLSAMSVDLQQSNEPLKLSAQNIDTAILEAASAVSTSKPLLDYLLPCFKRAVHAATASRRPSPEKQAVLDESKRLCLSNCIFALSMPEYFG